MIRDKSFSYLQSNLTALANTNYSNNPSDPRTIMLLETDYPYTGTANSMTEPISMWPATPAGQEAEFVDVRNLMLDLPHNDGEGVLYWYPEAVYDSHFNINNSGNTALWDSNGNALAALSPTTGAFNVTGAITATWIENQNADWNTAGNWLGDAVPNGVGDEADLLAAITAAHTISSSVAVTLGSLYFSNSSAYTLGGTGSLTMQASTGSAVIDVISGSHTIDLPLTIASSTTITVGSGALTIAAPITVNPSQSLSLALSTGSAAIIAAHGANPTNLLQLASLSFGGSAGAWLGKLDLNDNDMIVHNGDPATIASQISAGYNGGGWNGSTGITSSAAAAAGNTALAVELNQNNLGAALLTTFDGQTVTNTDVLVKYTYFGDANLDGIVNGSDYTLIDNGFNNGLNGWRNGDFNYDGVINGDDYTLIDNAFNTQNGPPQSEGLMGAEEIAQLNSTTVPEPIGFGGIVFAAVGLFSRRNRRENFCAGSSGDKR